MQNHIVKNYNLKAEIRIAPSLLRISALRFMGHVDKISTDKKRGQKSNALHKREVRDLEAAACRWCR